MNWFDDWLASKNQPPTVPVCIWESPNPYESLVRTAKWHYHNESIGIQSRIHSILCCAIPTRNIELFAMGFSLMAQTSIPEPWNSYYTFEMIKSMSDDKAAILNTAHRVLANLSSTNHAIALSVARELYSLSGQDLKSVSDLVAREELVEFLNGKERMLRRKNFLRMNS
jgi:hypothetical protein